MILFLILLILLAFAGKMVFGMALEVAGAVIGIFLAIIFFIIKRRNQR